MTQEEKIKDLEQRIAIMDADNSALCTDLEHWKKVVAGQKGKQKQMTTKLQEQNSIIKEKGNTIIELESRIEKMSEIIRIQLGKIEELVNEADFAETNLKYYMSLPWWKKIFRKTVPTTNKSNK